ncbi:hypothetical protein TrRE_jg8727 [Triparma retinervis]|uniref:Protein kinase domain-containing protein n=1 Tax=Triparma retinervis TaxID=2557542 RepID=A0A9W7DU24_9STRA|nr:hypothetical protein TrRE_jg8727 [Triparma retinervis]
MSFCSGGPEEPEHQAQSMIAVASFCRRSSKYVFEDSARAGMGRRPAKKSFFELNQKAKVRGSDEENYSPDRTLGLLGKQNSGSSRKLNSPTFILSTMQVPLLCPFTFHSDAEKKAFAQLLTSLQSPYIAPALEVEFSDSETSSRKQLVDIMVVRPYYNKGSIRDEIYKNSNPTDPYTSKYPRSVKGTPLHHKKIRTFGRQILEAMLFLKKKNITVYNLSSSNVLLHSDGSRTVAQLSDIENSLLCKSPATSLENLTLCYESRVNVDALHFGHLLFEMALGHRLSKPCPCPSVLQSAYEGVNAEVAEVLNLIFNPPTKPGDAVKVSIENVLKCSLFKDTPIQPPKSVKLSHSAKKIVKVCMASISNFRTARVMQYEEVFLGMNDCRNDPTMVTRTSFASRTSSPSSPTFPTNANPQTPLLNNPP